MSLNFDLRTVLYCFPMPGWRSFFRSGSLTSCGLCFLVLCVTPYLLDVAICEESSAPPQHQPALMDGEEVEPPHAAALFLSHDDLAQSLILLSDNRENSGTLIDSAPPIRPNNFTVVSLTSRPPPFA
jgi:hypothetical protein